MYTIMLSNGLEIENLELNGNNYVSKTKIDENIFTKENLSKVTIFNKETIETFENLIFVQQMEIQGEFYLFFREHTEQELKDKKLEEENLMLMLAITELYEVMI